MLIQSSDTNYRPLLYSVSLPSFVRDRERAKRTWALLTDAQIGTGAATFMGIRVLLDHGIPEHQILLLTLLASAQGGLWSIHHAFPKVRIITASVDPGLRRCSWPTSPSKPPTTDNHGTVEESPKEDPSHERVAYAIIPGCGQMGDRFWGT